MDNTNRNGAEPGELNILSQINAVLAKWRILVLSGLILAILAGAYNYRKQTAAINAWEGPESSGTEEESELPAEPDYTEIRTKVLDTINDKLEYYGKSYQWQIDPDSVARATADIYIMTEALKNSATVTGNAGSAIDASAEGTFSGEINTLMTPEEREAAQIIDAYCRFGGRVLDYAPIAAEFDVDPQYIREIVSYGGQDYSLMRAVITVSYMDEEGAEKILDYLIEQTLAYKETVTKEFGEHELTVRNKAVNTVIDSGYGAVVVNRTTEINNLIKQYNDLKTNEGNFDVKIIETNNEKPVLSKGGILKMAIAGFIGGVILYAALYLLYLALSSKVITARDLNDYYGFRKLSVIPDEKLLSKKGIDRMIASDSIRYASNKDPEKCLEILEGNLRAVNPDVSKVAIVSDLGKEALEGLAEKLRASGSTLQYEVLGELNEPADIRTVEECDGVVVAARTMESRYNRLNDLIRSLKENGRTIFGSVVF